MVIPSLKLPDLRPCVQHTIRVWATSFNWGSNKTVRCKGGWTCIKDGQRKVKNRLVMTQGKHGLLNY